MPKKPLLAFAALAAIWGTTWSAIKIGLPFMSPLLFAAVRSLIAALVTAVIGWRLRPRLPNRPRWWLGPVVFGLFNGPAFGLIFWGEQMIDSAQAAILNATVPIFTLLIAHLALGDPITSRKVVALTLGFSGVALVFSKALAGLAAIGAGARAELLGNLALIGAAALYGSSTVWGKSHLRDVPPLVSTGIMLGVAGTSLLAMSLAFERPRWDVSSATLWASLLYLAVVGFVLAYLCYFYLLRELPAVQVAYVSIAIPVVAVIAGAVVLSEPLTPTTFLGMVVILTGLFVLNRPEPSRAGPVSARAEIGGQH